jgi:glycosyltransferase involved in cell wall biosynthesis
LHFGWDWTLKGGELFAAMLRNLRQRNERVVGLTVGGEPPDDVGGALRAVPPQDDVTAFYACADAFVSCSPAEGMPFAVLEALACGLTVVATDIPGHVALLDRADGCRLAPPGNSEAIAMAVVDALAAAPERRRQAALANRERIVREADVRPWATRLLDRYERLAGVAGEAAVA